MRYEAEVAPGERYEAPTAMRAFGRGGVAGGSYYEVLAVIGDGKILIVIICGGGDSGTE